MILILSELLVLRVHSTLQLRGTRERADPSEGSFEVTLARSTANDDFQRFEFVSWIISIGSPFFPPQNSP